MDNTTKPVYLVNIGGQFAFRVTEDMMLHVPGNIDWDRDTTRYMRMGVRLCVYLTDNSNKDNESP